MTDTPAAERLVRSRYFLLGPHTYRDAAGAEVRVGYSARTAKTMVLPAPLAARLDGPRPAGLTDGERASLTRARALVPEDEDELAAVVGAMRAAAASASVRRVVVMPTAHCNMGCAYCGQEHERGPVQERRARATVRRVLAMIADPATEEVRIGWFGGEPLLGLRVMREMSAEFTAAADRHGTRYQAKIATNGSLLTARTLRVLREECRVRSIEVTVDGPQEVHDARRAMRNGRGTFLRTLDVLARALADDALPGVRVGLRTNVDTGNEAHVPDLLADLACMGFGHPQVQIHLAPVHSWGNDVSEVELAARAYAERENGWLTLAHGLGLNVVAVPGALKDVTCIATTRNGELHDARGTVYSCTEHPLVPGYAGPFALGTVDELTGEQPGVPDGSAGPRPEGPFDGWYDSVAAGGRDCSRCPLLPVCGGRCPKLWSEGHVPCPSMKFDWAAKLDLAARQRGLVPVAADGRP